MKKKVICLVIDTELTNEEIEREFSITLTFFKDKIFHQREIDADARNVRVLDSDEIKEREDD